jgi:hypothetical protein
MTIKPTTEGSKRNPTHRLKKYVVMKRWELFILKRRTDK